MPKNFNQRLGQMSAEMPALLRLSVNQTSSSCATRASTVQVLVSGLNGSSKMVALPDSGADLTAADIEMLPRLGENVENLLKPSNKQTSAIDGSHLKAIGQLPVTITLGKTSVEDCSPCFSIHTGRNASLLENFERFVNSTTELSLSDSEYLQRETEK